MDTLIVDLDNTITIETIDRDYSNKKVNVEVLESLHRAKDLGYKIHIFTARNMRTFNGDVGLIKEHTLPVIVKWLQDNNVPYDSLDVGKPWCGKGGFYIDDKNLSIEQFNFKMTGPYSRDTVDIVVPLYNEEGNISFLLENLSRLERLFNINAIVCVNNGSSDNTLNELNLNKLQYNKLEIVNLRKNLGYGGGMKEGLKCAKGDWVMTCHADNQFDAYNFFNSNLDLLLDRKEIFPKRVNRGVVESFNSWLLRMLLSIRYGRRIVDFNGQPKLIKRGGVSLSDLSSDFRFDLQLFLKADDYYSFPVVQKPRLAGMSSWSSSVIKRVKIFLTYIFK